ncbi:hypothetical protein V2J09_005352 [Rumex salicifolius]
MKSEGCKADAVTFNVVIGGLFREKFDEAVSMLERLPYEGVYLNKTSYRMTLNALCDSGETDKATKLLKLMLRRGFVPHLNTSNKVLILMCEGGKAGEAAKALFLMMDMGFKPETNTWNVLLEIVCRDRKLLPAFELLDQLTMCVVVYGTYCSVEHVGMKAYVYKKPSLHTKDVQVKNEDRDQEKFITYVRKSSHGAGGGESSSVHHSRKKRASSLSTHSSFVFPCIAIFGLILVSII